MAVQINVAANQAALTASIQAGVQAYNQRFAQNNPINLSINQRAFSQPLGRMTGDVKDFEAALAASNARVIAFGASTAVLGGVIRSFKELANVTIEVEKNLADINRVFGLTTSQLQKFSTDLFNVTKQTASSFDDASKAALEFSRQGLKAEDTLQRTKDALTLTRLAGISTANAVDALTSTVNGFAATGVTTTQILNKLVAVEQDYAVGAGDLAEALSRTGQAAQEAGVGLDQLNALVTAAQQSTARGGAVIGNALKTIFTRLQRTDTLDQLEAFNISVRDVQGNILPAVTILQNFAGAYKNLADAQRAQLSEQVAGVYQVNILKAIVNDLNKSQGVYAGALQRGASATNEAEIATAKLNQTLDALLKQTATSTQQLANNIGKVTFEPLAKYGTEQLKSFVESMNEILEGEGVGSTFANGLLKGIRNVIAGPGAIAAFFTLFKLIQNSFTYLGQALPQIAGITTETQNRKNIEQSILQIMQQQGPVSQALAGTMGNQAAQAQLLLQVARQQTAEYQMQTTLAKQLAVQLAGQGVRVKGSGGLQVTRSGGYIPASTKMAEIVGAKAGGYSSGRVVSSPVGGVMNTAEDVKYIPGFAQPFINPPAGSKAGRKHRQNAISRTGVDPYMNDGFIPNFAYKNFGFKNNELNLNRQSIKDFSDPSYFEKRNLADGGLNENGKPNDIYDTVSGVVQRIPFVKKKQFNLQAEKYFSAYLKDEPLPFVVKQSYDRAFNKIKNAGFYGKVGSSASDIKIVKNQMLDKFNAKNKGDFYNFRGSLYESYVAKKAGSQYKLAESEYSRSDVVPIDPEIAGLFTGIEAKSGSTGGNWKILQKAIETAIEQKQTSFNEDTLQDIPIGKYAVYQTYNDGFIPNFAIPVDSARIPWFKKYASSYKNIASDKDVFRQIDFPTYGKGLDHNYAKVGNADMVSFLYEDFVRSAINIALGSKQVVRSKEAGFKHTPTNAISNRDPIDLTQKISPSKFRMIEVKQSKNNQKETISQISDAKLKGLFQENPELAKNVELMSIIFNDPRYVDPTGKNPAGVLSPFEQSIAPIVKNSYADVDPTMRGKLGLLTDGLLRRYEAKKNTTYDGFIPNFSMGDKMRTTMMKNNLRVIVHNLESGRTAYAQPGTKGKEYLYHKDAYNAELNTKKQNINDFDFAELPNLVRGFIRPNGQVEWDWSDKQRDALKDKNIKTKILAKLAAAVAKANIPKFESNKLSDFQLMKMQLEQNSYSGFIPNFASGTDIYKGYAFNNTGKIYNDLYHSDAWDSIEGSTAGAIKYAYHNNKLLLQTNKAISPILKKAFLSRGVPESAFSPVEDVDSMMRSKNKQEIDDKLKNLGSVQLSSGIQAILEKGYYRKLIKGQQFYNIPGGVSPEELKIFGGVDGWVKYQEQNYGPLKWGSYASGFIPNLANFIDVDTLGKNSVHYSGDLMKLIKDIEASIGRNLSSGELRFLTNPKTNLSKLNDPKVLNKFINSERKGGFAGFANGFVPNFAYKQAVMGLEESMSGNKAIFDTKPFPHIRNSSQPTFSSAIADHGGLGNALSDSMRGQKAAGLMSKGFIPNFVKYGPSYSYMPSGVPSGSSDYYPSGNPNKSQAVSPTYQAPAAATNATFQQNDIDKALQDFINSVQAADQKLGIFESTFGGRTKIIDSELIKLKNTLSKGGVSGSKLNEALDNASTKINSEQTKLGKALEKSSTTLAIAGPLIAGQLEQLFFANKKRTELSETERAVQSGLSTGLTSISTGASIGAAFGPLGAGIGAATGALVGLTSALSATKLSAEELADLNQEQAQKAQANISAASSYIEAQKSLTQMIASGASSSDIENASKKLAVNFKEIEDVKLQEIFNSTGGDVKKMTEELQKYSNEISRRSAFQKGIIEKSDVKTTVQALSIGIPKQNKKDVIEGFRKAASFSQSEMQYEQAIKQAEYGSNRKNNEGKTYKQVIDEAEKFRKENIASSLENFIPRLLDIGGITKDDPQYKSEFDNALKKFKSLPPEKLKEIADNLEKADLVSGVSQSIDRLNNVATKSFNQIFLEIEQRIAKTAFDISLNFERDSGQRRIQSAILDFSINFQDSINSFLSNNLPDARKFDFTAATAGQKAQLQLQKSQQDYDKAIAEQANERSMFLNKSTKDLTETFKSSFLPSQASAQFFEQNVLSQLESGTFAGDAKSLAKQMQTKAFTEAQAPVKAAGFNLNNINNVDTVLKQITDKMEAVSTSAGATSDEYIKLESALRAIRELQKQTALYTNDNDVKKLQNAIDSYTNEKALFDLKQANAKKELEINKQLNEARIAVDKDIAVEKAKVDKQILMRMESMKDVSAQIGNTLELSKANINASIAALQSNLEDSRQNYGKGSSQILERKIDIQDSILKQQRELEDQTIKSEIQQRILQMAAEQENTAATLELNKTIMALIETQLRGALGGQQKIEEISATAKRMGTFAPANIDKKYGTGTYAQYQALQRIQESRTASASINGNYNTSNFAANMEAAGFNKTDENGNLMMSTQEQINFLSKEELKAKQANNIVLEGTIQRYKEEIRIKEKSLSITREQLDKSIALKNEEGRAMVTFSGRLSAGFGKLSDQADNIIHNLAEELPMKFADNMSSALMEVAKGTKSIGDAFQDMAINFGQMIMQEVLRAAIAKTLGNIGIGSLFGQAGGNVSSRGIGYQHGGVIRANNGQYVSGMGSGDRYPAMLENGEYVLNREAVKRLGGKKSLDTFNFEHAPRFASGGNVSMEAEMALNKDQEMDYTKNLLYNRSNIGAINENDYTAYAYSESDYFKKMREKAIANEQKRVQESFARKQKNAQLISSLVGTAGSLFLAAGMSGLAKAGASGSAVSSGAAKAKPASLGSGMGSSNISSFSTTIGSQRGGMIGFNSGGFVPYGSRLSDTIPALLTGGEYVMNNSAVRKYGLGAMNAMNAGAMSNSTNNNSTSTNNNTNNNATNISINIDRSGKATYGSDTSSYEKNDIAFSKQMAKRVADIAKGVISDESRYGGKIYQR